MEKIDRKAFRTWMQNTYPNLAPGSITTKVSEAFYLQEHMLGITLEEIVSGKKSRDDYVSALKVYLRNNGKQVKSRPFGLAANLKYLLIYLNELNPNTSALNSWSLKKGKQSKNSDVIKPLKLNDKPVMIKQSSLDINDVIAAIRRFHARNKEGEFTRYRSWVYCYTIFRDKWHDKSSFDLLALNLSFYLASWGMLRPSCFLLQFDYKVHYTVIEKLTDPHFAPLYEDALTPNYPLVEEARKIILNGYGQFKPTPTLITKILLGIFACTPAYDRFFTFSLKKYKLASSTFSISSLKKVWQYYDKHKIIFDELGEELNSEGVKYPPMKLMDMALFQLGLESFKKNKQKAQVN